MQRCLARKIQHRKSCPAAIPECPPESKAGPFGPERMGDFSKYGYPKPVVFPLMITNCGWFRVPTILGDFILYSWCKWGPFWGILIDLIAFAETWRGDLQDSSSCWILAASKHVRTKHSTGIPSELFDWTLLSSFDLESARVKAKMPVTT